MNYEAGERIGDYQVVERIGAGGMGAVYKVRNLITDRIDAMKVLLPDLRQAPDLAERFSREIKVHASLVHPNIAALLTAMRVENQLLMIMEFVDGTSLANRLRQGPLQCQEAVNYICQVLSALSYAHQRGIIHRDIKPANIMVTANKTVKLMDFGIATTTGGGSLQNRLTAAGMALGSVHYMSPEQVKAGAPDARSDLYSLGITFYEMVTGQCPIRGNSEYEIMAAHLALAPPSPIELNPFLPPTVAAIIQKAIQKRPDDRFQTAAEFRASLESLMGTSVHTPPQPMTAVAAGLEALVRTPTPASGTSIINPAIIEATVKDLAAHIGPMAKIIVNRAAKQAQSPKQLYETVAQEIPSVADRIKFLQKRGA
ncbi:MAG TPA: serine/threonine-protein kinase [Bryobacteraceae bacterium]|nr:serine/threonine-protein kinase [Bryobacteraceae bacterium]